MNNALQNVNHNLHYSNMKALYIHLLILLMLVVSVHFEEKEIAQAQN